MLLLCSDVHGLHPHGAPGQEAEPEPSREGTRAGEGHGQHQRPEGPRPQEEREEVLLSRPQTTKHFPLIAYTKTLKEDWEPRALDLWLHTPTFEPVFTATTQQTSGQSAVNVTEAEGLQSVSTDCM